MVTRVSSAGRTSCERVRPRSSTLGTNNSKGEPDLLSTRYPQFWEYSRLSKTDNINDIVLVISVIKHGQGEHSPSDVYNTDISR